MLDVVDYFALTPKLNKASVDVLCPLCGHRTLHFDFRKNVFACPACGIGGGIMDAWALFAGIDTGDIKENRRLAKLDLEEKLKHSRFEVSDTVMEFKEENEIQMASIAKRDRIYRRLISDLTLSDKHKKDLMNRGLSEKEIEAFGFKTLKSITYPDDMKGVPGFYPSKGKWKLVNYEGFLIPQYNVDGKLQSCQIRKDSGTPKYLALSSAKFKGGTAGATFTHFTNVYDQSPKEIVITEGPLKADIINLRLKLPVIAIPGVNAQKYLEQELQKLKAKGLCRAKIAFDMDYYTNPNVKKALNKLKKLLSDLEIEFVQLEWDSSFKGLDDYLNSKT